MDTTVDCKNQTVEVGDIVRVITLAPAFIKQFPADERILIESMVGNFFKVVAIEDGAACVEREWHNEKGQLQSHVIGLDSDEMEKV